MTNAFKSTIHIKKEIHVEVTFDNYEVFVGFPNLAPMGTSMTSLMVAKHIYENYPITHIDILNAYVQYRINERDGKVNE